MPDVQIGFRLLDVGDPPLVHDWLGEEQVRRVWGEPGSYDEVVDDAALIECGPARRPATGRWR